MTQIARPVICSCDTVAPLPNDTYTIESFGCLFGQSNSKPFLDELPDCVTIGPIGYIHLKYHWCKPGNRTG